MENQNRSGNKYVVEVEFNQQQEVILKQLVEDGRYGADYSEVIRRVFQEFLRLTRI